MTKQESVAAQIRLAFDFLRYLCENPEQVEAIPQGAYIEIVSADNPILPRPVNAPVVAFRLTRSFQRLSAAG
jgi:hypothetical protein